MKKILFSAFMILSVVGASTGATMAYLSDVETSVGNTFTAGTIDLKVDNESYYNGAVSKSTTFGPSDLDQGKLFLNFQDLKPDDEGEDTISLHVNNNDAYLCMDMALTSDDDRSSNEPELGAGDAPEDPNNTWDGELASLINMVWWVDDGDNVLETDEALLSGVKTIKDMFGPNRTFTADLADATTNVWTPNTPGPVPGGETKYIAKAWCFGNMTLNPVAQDGAGKLPGSTNGPLSRGGGFTCDGTALDNKSQTDGLTMNIAFRAVQARHNPRYTCNTEQRMGTITVTKVVINDNGGNNIVSDFQLFVVDGPVIIPVTSGVPTVVPVGNYIVTETGINGYQASFSGDCNASGQVTIAEGDNKQCTVTNNDIPASITLVKNVVGGSASPIQFTMRVDGNVVPHNGSVPVTSNSPHTISEDPFPGYTFTGVSGAGCPATLPGNVILNEGQAIVCTITNTQNP